MKTKIIYMEEENLNIKALQEAGQILQSGGIVAFPTETVYGLGGDALNENSSGKIYKAKGRPSDNPLIVHICRWEALKPLVRGIPENAKMLAQAFWPGPLTMIMYKSDIVPLATTGGLDTIAVRMPGHKTALALIEAAGGYIAAPSANLSGKPSPTLAKYVAEDMDGRIDMIIDGGAACFGLESTIIDLTESTPVILRPGYVTQEMLQKVIGPVSMDRAVLDDNSGQAPRAPGMKYKHYAPQGELTIILGKQEAVIESINQKAFLMQEKGEKVGVICAAETYDRYRADSVKSVGSRADETAAARSLYRILREFDDENVSVIYSEGFENNSKNTGIGQAVMNRLLKAAGHHIENV